MEEFMAKRNESLRDRLLARLPQPENLATYQEEVAAKLEKNEKWLRWERWVARVFWFFVVGYFMYGVISRGNQWLSTPQGHKFELVSLILFISGATVVLKHLINRSRIELLKEVKQLQLQLLEVQASLRKES
jgi:fucose 4-O-acetylase-like acetyltransferase